MFIGMTPLPKMTLPTFRGHNSIQSWWWLASWMNGGDISKGIGVDLIPIVHLNCFGGWKVARNTEGRYAPNNFPVWNSWPKANNLMFKVGWTCFLSKLSNSPGIRMNFYTFIRSFLAPMDSELEDELQGDFFDFSIFPHILEIFFGWWFCFKGFNDVWPCGAIFEVLCQFQRGYFFIPWV